MVISFPCNDEAGKVLLPQEHLNLTPTPSPKGEGGVIVYSSQHYQLQYPYTLTG